MRDLIVYIIMAALGYAVGSRFRGNSRISRIAGRVQTAAIILLVFTMGLRMGSNQEVISKLSTIGLSAFAITVTVLFFSVLCVWATRKLLGIDRFGRVADPGPGTAGKTGPAAGETAKVRRFNPMTLYIVASVAAGMVFGYFFTLRIFGSFERFDDLAGKAIFIGLCILLWFVGLDLGFEGTLFGDIKSIGLRVFAVPAATVAGTLAASCICAGFIPVSFKEMMAIGAGFGWYTYAPGVIMNAGFATASAIAFMHNVMREVIGMVLVPTVAKRIGYVESTCLTGAAAMDVSLPIIEKSTDASTAVYALVSGGVLSILVPVLVPLIISL